ncbi:hypothetical protein ZWY2020_056228 [Hordeum vulgare]|nr:hypothetical protein ZWY2020_056228 [Hordeum vulgare]
MPLHLFSSSARATHLPFRERFSAAPVLHLLSHSPRPCLPSGDPVARPSSPYSQPQTPLRPIPSCHPQRRLAATPLSHRRVRSSQVTYLLL